MRMRPPWDVVEIAIDGSAQRDRCQCFLWPQSAGDPTAGRERVGDGGDIGSASGVDGVGTGRNRRAGRDDVVDEHDTLRHAGARAALDRAGQRGEALAAATADLPAGSAAVTAKAVGDPHAGPRSQRRREPLRLVVAAQPQARRVERDGHQQSRRAQQAVGRAGGDLSGHRPREPGGAAELQPAHERTRGTVIGDRSPGRDAGELDGATLEPAQLGATGEAERLASAGPTPACPAGRRDDQVEQRSGGAHRAIVAGAAPRAIRALPQSCACSATTPP
jgi:hypothetical protein